jgi:hypothetical protein
VALSSLTVLSHPGLPMFSDLSDVTTVEARPRLIEVPFHQYARTPGVLTGSSTFEPLAKKASYTFIAPPK